MSRPKRSMSNFDIAVLLNELSQAVIGAWINNIYQINEVFLFKLNTNSGDKTLLVEPGLRIHLTRYLRNAPRIPPNFCVALRKHIRNGRVERIKQFDLDRIVAITIDAHSKKYNVVVELFGEGNLILCDAQDRIILARHYKTMRDRSIKPKEVFAPPPLRGTDLTSLSKEQAISIIESSSAGLAETLASSLNIDPLYAEEICSASDIEKNRKANELTNDEKVRIAEEIHLLISRLLNGPYQPQTIVDESGNAISAAPFSLAVYRNLTARAMSSFNEVLDEFFSSKEASTATALGLKEQQRGIDEIENVIREQRKKIEESEKLANRYRRFGDLIYSNLTQIDEIISGVMSARKKGLSWGDIESKLIEAKSEGVALVGRVSALNVSAGSVTLDLDGEEIPIDFRISAPNNAAAFYEAAKKADSKRKGAENALQNALEKSRERRTKRASLREEGLRTKRQKKWYEHYRWFISSNGLVVIGGRDAKTNEMIVRRKLEPDDIFVHADVHGASVVLIKTEGKEAPEATIIEACQFSLLFSRLWKLGVGAGDAYWVRGDQVSLSPPSGEYLQKGSFMVRGQRNYMKGLSLRISIGVVTDEEEHVFLIAGPPSSLVEKTDIRVELAPGEESGPKLISLIKYKLANLATSNIKKEIERMPIDEFLSILPSGGSSIVEQ